VSAESTLRAVAATLLGAGHVGTGVAHSGLRAAGALVEAIADLLAHRTDEEVRVLLRQLAATPPRRIQTDDTDARIDAAIAAKFLRSEPPPSGGEDDGA
jgi:predicted homoserine dehydrogenase-like protein